MSRRALIAVPVVLLVAGLAGWLLLGDDAAAPPATTATAPPGGTSIAGPDRPALDPPRPRPLPGQGQGQGGSSSGQQPGPRPAAGGAVGPQGPPPGPARLVGRVVDPQGQPIPGALVLAGGLRGEELGPVIAESDRAGEFRLDELPPTGVLEVTAQGFARRVVAVDAAMLRVDVVLVPARRLEGRVVAAEDHAPLQGALVEGESSSWRNRARTDGDGRFVFDDVPDEQAVLVVTFDGRRGAVAEERDAALIALERGRAVGGTVVDPAGAPVAGALVFVVGADQLAHPHTTRADGAGRFEVTGVGADEAFAVLAFGASGGEELATPLDLAWVEGEGRTQVALVRLRTVVVRGAPDVSIALAPLSCPPGVPAAAPRAGVPGPRGVTFEGVVPGAWQVWVRERPIGPEVQVPVGDPGAPVVVEWSDPAAAAVPERRQGVLRVRVLDEQRRPVAAATVVVSGLGADDVRQTGPDGVAAFERPPGGALTVSATSPGRVLVAPAHLDDVLSGELELALARPVTLEGRVQLPAGARGAAFISLSGPDGTLLRSAQTGPDGRFRLVDLAPGRAVLEAAADGCAPLEMQLELPLSGELLVPLETGGGHDHPEGEHGHDEHGRG